jgi:hypothetical protein
MKIMDYKNTESDIFGIAYECPKRNRDNDCPLFEIDHLSFKEKLDWIDDLDDDKKKAIKRHHTFCTKKEITK